VTASGVTVFVALIATPKSEPPEGDETAATGDDRPVEDAEFPVAWGERAVKNIESFEEEE
jgi:hypothetical protein